MKTDEYKSKFIIIDPEEGIFLGTAKPDDIPYIERHPRDGRLIALFSCNNNNALDIIKAVGFFTKDDAERYLHIYIKNRCNAAFVAEVKDDSVGPYVDVVSIVKAGYGEFAWDMIDALPSYSEMEH